MRYYIMSYYYYRRDAPRPKKSGLLRDEQGHFLEFDSKEKAQKYIDKVLDKDEYIFDDGEWNRPDYKVVSPDLWGSDCYLVNGTELGPDYIPVAEDDVPPEIRKILLSSRPEYVRSEEFYHVYAAYHDDYAIIYCPRLEALDYYADNPSNLHWSSYHFAKKRL